MKFCKFIFFFRCLPTFRNLSFQCSLQRGLILLVCCFPLLLSAKTNSQFKLKGVKGKLMTNIENRLNELNQPLATMNRADLSEQIVKAMSPYGYFNPKIHIQPYKNHLLITILPGQRLLVSSFFVHIIGEGKENKEIIQALKTISLAANRPFNSVTYEETKQALITAAENQGYLRAFFNTSEILIDKHRNKATVNLILDTGPQYYFGQVEFDPTNVSPELLHRYVPFHYGQPFSNDKVLEFNNALSNSGYFSHVAVKQKTEDKTLIPINVHLQPAPRYNYSVGLGFGTDTGLRGQAGYHVTPVDKSGKKFNAIALGSFKENGVQTQYIIPGKKPTIDQYELTGSFTNLNYNSGKSNSLLFSAIQRHNLTYFQRALSINGLYERYNYTHLHGIDKLIFYPKASFTWLKRSSELFSRNGYKITLNGLAAKKAILSEINFSQTYVDAKAAFSVFKTRFYFHTIQGLTQISDINQLPLSLSFLLGGSDNLKGFSYNSIGPGKKLTFGGFELQQETKENWYIIGFIDAGDVYQPRTRQLKRDAGIGLMWVSPVGPIKIGVAQPIDEHFHRIEHSTPRLVINMGPDL